MQRNRVNINVGNLLETIAALLGADGVYRLAGFGWALIAAFVLLVALAEWVFPVSVWKMPLPQRPKVKTRIEERKQALQIHWYRFKATFRARRIHSTQSSLADPADPEIRG